MEKGKLKLKDVVEKLLREDEECRTDTKILTIKVIGHYTRIFIPPEDIKKIPTFESIARCKRDFMNKPSEFSKEFVPEEGVIYEKPIAK